MEKVLEKIKVVGIISILHKIMKLFNKLKNKYFSVGVNLLIS